MALSHGNTTTLPSIIPVSSHLIRDDYTDTLGRSFSGNVLETRDAAQQVRIISTRTPSLN